jgi:hypothetical protein
MVPEAFHDYFFASAGAGAALVGLLFVALSIAPERTLMRGALVERQSVAFSGYTALLNAFFLSMTGLLPGTNLGGAALVLSLLALMDQGVMIWIIFKYAEKRRLNVARQGALVLAGLFLYGVELYNAIYLLLFPTNAAFVSTLATVVLGLYALGMARAWQLLGTRSFRLASWLSSIHNTEEGQLEIKASQEHTVHEDKGNVS